MSQPLRVSAGVTRFELVLLIVCILLGALARLIDLSHSGLSHFDEGVYALWGLGVDFPGKEFFSPPLFPLLLQAGFSLFGPDDCSALAVSGIAGTLSIALVWWVARRWYGPVAGVTSMAMAAFSGYHIAFSRMALTDVCFTFWFVLGLWLTAETFFRCQKRPAQVSPAPNGGIASSVWSWAVGAGLAAGAAMNTKYYGLLVHRLDAWTSDVVNAVTTSRYSGLVIALFVSLGVAAGFAFWHGTRSRKDWIRRFSKAVLAVAFAGAIAVLLYLPWLHHVNSTIGRERFLAHHHGYTTGISNWPGNLLTLLVQHWCITPWFGRLGPGVAVAMAISFSQRVRHTPRPVELAVFTGALCFGLLVGDAAGWLLGLAGAVILIRRHGAIGVIQATWLVGLLLLTPLYRPYARLALPLIAGGWIAAGGVVSVLFDSIAQVESFSRIRNRVFSGAAVLVVISLLAGVLAARAGWISSHELNMVAKPPSVPVLKTASRVLADQLLPEHEVAVAFVRPPVLFYIAGERRLDLRSDLSLLETGSALSQPRYLLIDQAMLLDNPTAKRQLERAKDRLEQVGVVRYSPSAVVLLDDFGRACLQPEVWDLTTRDDPPRTGDDAHRLATRNASGPSLSPYQLIVYRIKPATEP